MIEHVTYAVASAEELHSEAFRDFFTALGMYEVDASGDILDKGWGVRWFKCHRNATIIHFVVDAQLVLPPWGLNHFCVVVGSRRFNGLRKTSPYLEHDGGAPVGDPLCRIWLKGPCGVRVEVQP